MSAKPNYYEHELGASARLDVDGDEAEYAAMFAEYRRKLLRPFEAFASRSADVLADQQAEDELRDLIKAAHDGDV